MLNTFPRIIGSYMYYNLTSTVHFWVVSHLSLWLDLPLQTMQVIDLNLVSCSSHQFDINITLGQASPP